MSGFILCIVHTYGFSRIFDDHVFLEVNQNHQIYNLSFKANKSNSVNVCQQLNQALFNHFIITFGSLRCQNYLDVSRSLPQYALHRCAQRRHLERGTPLKRRGTRWWDAVVASSSTVRAHYTTPYSALSEEACSEVLRQNRVITVTKPHLSLVGRT